MVNVYQIIYRRVSFCCLGSGLKKKHRIPATNGGLLTGFVLFVSQTEHGQPMGLTGKPTRPGGALQLRSKSVTSPFNTLHFPRDEHWKPGGMRGLGFLFLFFFA